MEHGRRILCLLATIWLVGCGPRSNTSVPDPVADAKAALAQGDRRVVGYMGYALVVPGTPPGFQHWTYAPGVNIVSNVTDTSPRKAIKAADDYATRYNRVVLVGSGGAP
ncbi:MAG TPA: hypothetical protein VF669_09310 [Tepidisphaeraceae bacterium]|jgi:hypothetical protein